MCNVSKGHITRSTTNRADAHAEQRGISCERPTRRAGNAHQVGSNRKAQQYRQHHPPTHHPYAYNVLMIPLHHSGGVMTGMEGRKEENNEKMQKMIMIMDVDMAGHPRPMSGVFFFFSFSFPHLIVSWFVYACQPVGVSCFYAVSMLFPCMHVVCNGSGVRLCGCRCVRVMMLWYVLSVFAVLTAWRTVWR